MYKDAHLLSSAHGEIQLWNDSTLMCIRRLRMGKLGLESSAAVTLILVFVRIALMPSFSKVLTLQLEFYQPFMALKIIA